MRVFASPGKSSIRTCPSARMARRISSSASRLPTTAFSTSARILSEVVRTSFRFVAAMRSERLQAIDRLPQVGRRDARAPAVGAIEVSGRHQRPGGFAEDSARWFGVAFEVDSAARSEAMGGDVAQEGLQAAAEVDCVPDREIH